VGAKPCAWSTAAARRRGYGEDGIYFNLAAGEAEQACNAALVALAAGEQIRSGRCVNYPREFRDHLAIADRTSTVPDFSDQAAQSRMWRIAGRSDTSATVT
jgi:hypothetical protein